LSVGRHVFEVRALVGTDASDPATYAWTVAAEAVEPSPPPDEGAGGSGDENDAAGALGGTSSQGTGAADDGAPFDISGGVGGLAPGITKPILLTLRNPNAYAIRVISIVVEISDDSTPPGCSSASNVALSQADGISEDDPVVVPGRGTVVLSPGQAPAITLRDQPWNQDVCKGRSFELTYSGRAHS
jgi:hypothetical protein